jgi:hypothetical protein
MPEMGVEVPLKRTILLANVRYARFFKSADVASQSYWNFSVGVGFE